MEKKLVYTLDHHGRLESVTPAFAERFGIDPEWPDGQKAPFPWWPDEDRELLMLCKTFAFTQDADLFKGVPTVARLRVASGRTEEFLLVLDKLVDGSILTIVKEYLPENHADLETAVVGIDGVGKMIRGFMEGQAESPDVGANRLREWTSLSPREQDVADLLLDGFRVEEIAKELCISVHTVRNHRKALYAKLGVGSQVELLARFRLRGSEPTPNSDPE